MVQKEIFIQPNPDKEFLVDDKDLLMPASGARIIMAGRCGVGKGNACKNLIARFNPPLERICVYHIDPTTEEWKDCDAEMLDDIPDYGFFDRSKRNCLVLDETNFEGMSREKRGQIDRLVMYQATHYNVIIFILQQNFVSIPPAIRRAASWWVIWPSVDHQSMRDVSTKTGHAMKELAKLCKTKYDSITFDFEGDKYPLRLNMFQPILDEGEED